MRLKHSRSHQGGGALAQIVVVGGCVFAMLAFGWMLLLPGLFTSVIENRTGFPARVDSFYANPFTGEVRMRGLVVVNPAGFAESEFLDLQQFSAKADMFSLLGGNPVLDMTTLDVARITVVTNAQGTNNLDLVYRRLATYSAKKTPAPANSGATAPAVSSAPLQFLVRNLDVRLNEVVVKDERPGKVPQNIHQLAFQRTYKNVTPQTDFSANLPEAVTAAGKNVGEAVGGNLKQIVTRAIQPQDRKTYAWGDKRENSPAASQ
jgi:hypothetical protein